MPSLFDEEIKVWFRFINQDSSTIEDVNKSVGRLALNLNSTVVGALKAGEAVSGLAEKLSNVREVLSKLAKHPNLASTEIPLIARKLDTHVGRYSETRLKEIQSQVVSTEKIRQHRNTAMLEALERSKEDVDRVVREVAERRNLLPQKLRLLFLDVESTKKQILEMHARLVEFDTSTDRFGQTLRTYYGTQRYSNYGVAAARRADIALTARRPPRQVGGARQLPQESFSRNFSPPVNEFVNYTTELYELWKNGSAGVRKEIEARFGKPEPKFNRQTFRPAVDVSSPLSQIEMDRDKTSRLLEMIKSQRADPQKFTAHNTDVRFVGNKGINLEELVKFAPSRGGATGISGSMLRYLAKQADFIVGHNISFDIAQLSKIAPQLGTIPAVDSLRNIPWELFGFDRRGLQVLSKLHGVNAPGREHRAIPDVLTNVNLLGASHPQAIDRSSYMMVALRSLGFRPGSNPVQVEHENQAVPLLQMITEEAKRIHSDLKNELKSHVRYNVDVGVEPYVRPEDVGKITRKGKVDPAQLPSPAYQSNRSVALDSSMRDVEEFLRNASLTSPTTFVNSYFKSASEIEEQIQSRGLNQRSGDQVTMEIVKRLNKELDLLRPREKRIHGGRLPMLPSAMYSGEALTGFDLVRSTVGTGNFSHGSISDFLSSTKELNDVDQIKKATQMANWLGPNDRMFEQLKTLVLAAQAKQRTFRRSRSLAEKTKQLDERANALLSSEKPTEKLEEFDLGKLFDSDRIKKFLRDEEGSLNIGAFAGGLKKLRDFLRRRGASKSPQGQPPDDSRNDFFSDEYTYRATNYPLPDPSNLRSSIRRDALEARLRKLEESVEKAARAFEHFNNVVGPFQRRGAELAHEYRESQINRSFRGAMASADYQRSVAEKSFERSEIAVGRKIQDIREQRDDQIRALSLKRVEARLELQDALDKQTFEIERLRKRKSFKNKSEEELEALTEAPVKAAQLKMIKAEFEAESAKLTDRAKIDELRQKTAARYATTRLSRGTVEEQRNLASEIEEVLGGRTVSQRATRQASRLSQDLEADREQKEARKARINARERATAERLNDANEYNNVRFQRRLFGIDLSGQRLRERAQDLREGLGSAITAAKVKFLKTEAASGGGGRGADGGAQVSDKPLMSRGGLEIGIGIAGFVAMGKALRDVTQETVLYAAKTEMLEMATTQMARVNNLNVASVDSQVEAIKRLNISTQEAHSVTQKMIFANLDLSKSTQLARTAQDAAILTNVNSSEALDRIILGITTGQTRVLHNMNLQVSMLSVIKKLRQNLGREPTEFEKRTGMFEEVLGQGSKLSGTYEVAMLTAGKQMNSLTREFQEAKNAVGKEFLPEFGRLIQMLTTSLQFVQGNSKAFSEFASVLLSVGSALSVIGTAATASYLFGAGGLLGAGGLRGRINWVPKSGVGGLLSGIGRTIMRNKWTAGAAAAAGVATYMGMSGDDSDIVSKNALEQYNKLNQNIEKIGKERDVLIKSGPSSDIVEDVRKHEESLKNYDTAISSSQIQKKAVVLNLTQSLGSQFAAFAKEVGENRAKISGKRGLGGIFEALENFAMEFVSLKAKPESLLRLAALPFLGTTKEFKIPEAAKTLGVKESDVLVEGRRQYEESLGIRHIDPNISRMNIKTQMYSGMIDDAQRYAVNVEESLLPGIGKLYSRYRRRIETPEQGITRRREEIEAKLKEIPGAVEHFEKLKTTNPAEAEDSLRKLAALKDQQEGISKTVGEFERDEFAHLRAKTQLEINQIKERIELEQLQAKTISGKYASEMAAIKEAFEIRKKYIDQGAKLYPSPSDIEKKRAASEGMRRSEELKLIKTQSEGVIRRSEMSLMHESSLEREKILGDSRLSTEQAIGKALQSEQMYLGRLTNDEAKSDAILKSKLASQELLKDLRREEAEHVMSLRISRGRLSTDESSEIDRIVSGRGRSDYQRSLDEIQRTRLAERNQVSLELRERLAFLDTPEGVRSLGGKPRAHVEAGIKREADLAFEKIEAQSRILSVKAKDQLVESRREALAETYRQQFERKQRVMELTAFTEAEEIAAINAAHELRKDYIEKEFEARGKSLDALRVKEREIQQANFDHLQKLLEVRRREIGKLRDLAGSVFDAVTSPEAGSNLNKLILDQAKGTVRTIFQNLAVEYFKDIRTRIGVVVPGQTDERGNPTRLGRILSGTVFGKLPGKEETEKLLAEITKESVNAERELKTSIDDLNATLKQMSSNPDVTISPRSVVRLPATSKQTSSEKSPIDFTPIFGGASNIPGVFHLQKSSSANTRATQENTEALHLLSDTLKMKSSFSFLGGNGGSSSLFSQLLGGNSGLGGGQQDGGSPEDSLFVLHGMGGKSSGGSKGKMGKFEKAGVVAAGAVQAYSGFSKGGAKGNLEGIGGVLTAASAIPVIGPYAAMAAIAVDFVAALLPDPKKTREQAINRYLNETRYVAPVHINREMSTSGELLSYGKTQAPRSTGLGAFPIPIQPNQYIIDSTTLDQKPPSQIYVPGRVLNDVSQINRPSVVSHNYNVTVPVSAMDSKDVIARSKDIVAAFRKELKSGSDVTVEIQRSIFGSY